MASSKLLVSQDGEYDDFYFIAIQVIVLRINRGKLEGRMNGGKDGESWEMLRAIISMNMLWKDQ